MATKLGKMVSFLDRLPYVKSHDPFIMCSSEITCQLKIAMS